MSRRMAVLSRTHKFSFSGYSANSIASAAEPQRRHLAKTTAEPGESPSSAVSRLEPTLEPEIDPD
jgi:hypothetical protein